MATIRTRQNEAGFWHSTIEGDDAAGIAHWHSRGEPNKEETIQRAREVCADLGITVGSVIEEPALSEKESP